MTTGGHWNADLPPQANRTFDADFAKEYGRPPTLFAEQGYTTVLVFDAAIKAVQGRIEDKQAFRRALENVVLEAPRGPLRFSADHSPLQNIYLREVVKGAKGELLNRTQKTIATSPVGRGASTCSM